MKKDVCPTAANCYSYHATKRRAVIQAGSTSYGYDANGNMTSRGGSTIGYTSYNLPGVINAGSNSSTLSYGAYRNRYKQVAVTGGQSETTIYVGGILERVTKSGSTTWRHRIEGPGGLLAIVNCSGTSCDPTATTNYVHRDHLGSPELVTNSAGAEVVKLSFGAFGERRDRDWHGPVSSSDMTIIGNATRRGFTEHEHLDSVGLVHMNGRVYDPMLGRFLSSDPIEDGLGRPGGFNRYAYVSNRPLTLTDPSGYCPIGWGSPDGCTALFDYGFLRMWKLKVLNDWTQDLEASQGGGPYTGPLPPPRPPTGQPPPTSSPPAGPPAGPQPPGTSPPEPAAEPQKNVPPCSSITGASVDFTSQLGAYGSAGFHFKLLGLKIGVGAGLDLFSYNTPLSGDTYWSHGADLTLQIGKVRVGGSWEQRSYDGGLSFESQPTNFALGDLKGSSEGTNFEVTLPQVGAGFKAGVKNVGALLPVADTLICRP